MNRNYTSFFDNPTFYVENKKNIVYNTYLKALKRIAASTKSSYRQGRLDKSNGNH